MKAILTDIRYSGEEGQEWMRNTKGSLFFPSYFSPSLVVHSRMHAVLSTHHKILQISPPG